MKKSLRKIISLLLVICIMITLVPYIALDTKAATSNNWSWPTSIHSIKSDWPTYSSGKYHGGTDFPVSLNSPVYSTCDGEVVAVTPMTTSYGNHIKIRAIVNGATVYMRYCHLNSFAVNVGDKVSSGQLIGYSGSTGNSTGPHLHYEVRNANDYYGNASSPNLNPRYYLPGTSYTFQTNGPSVDFPGEEDTSWNVPVWKTANTKLNTYDSYGNQEANRWIDQGDNCYVEKVYKNGYAWVKYPSGSSERWAYTNASGFSLEKKTTVNNPTACVDSISGTNDGYIKIRGWAFDKDDTSAQLGIHVYVGGSSGSGAPGYAYTANSHRPDVNNVYGVGEYHGFDIKIPMSTAGNRSVYVYAINVGSGSNIEIGNGEANVTYDSLHIGNKFYTKIAHAESSKVLGVTDDGDVVIQTDTNSDNQIWHFERRSNNTYRITSVSNGKCLDLAGAITTNENNVRTWDSNDSDAQSWYIVSNGSGYSIVSKCHIHKVVDLYGNNTNDGSNISIHDRNDSAAQIFDIKEIDTSEIYEATITDEFNNHRYEYFDSSVTWKTAAKICEMKGGHLLTITSSEEQAFIDGFTKDFNDKYIWIGATDEGDEGNWLWITGEDMNYTNWADSQPDNAGNNEHYMHLNHSSKWNDNTDSGSTAKFGFVCEYEDIDETEFKPFKVITFNDKKYEFYSDCVTWEQASRICKQKGGYLATAQNKSENDMLIANINDTNIFAYWIGLQDKNTEGVFEWVTGESYNFSNWNSSEPDNHNSNEDYVMILTSSGKWSDGRNYGSLQCISFGFICEYDVQILKGDVNSDDVVNMKDIVLLQQYLNNWGVEINTDGTDVNSDGVINMKDIVLLQQYMNGWDVDLR